MSYKFAHQASNIGHSLKMLVLNRNGSAGSVEMVNTHKQRMSERRIHTEDFNEIMPLNDMLAPQERLLYQS